MPAGPYHKIRYGNTRPFDYGSLKPSQAPLFQKIDGNLGIDFAHQEDNYTDFNREKLQPYSLADRGPAFARGDLSGDGREDLFFGGSKFRPSHLYVQQDSSFVQWLEAAIQQDSLQEETVATIADFSGDGRPDLIAGSAGADFFGAADPLLDRYYQAGEFGFKRTSFPENYSNTSVVEAFDFDADGDLDLFLGNQGITERFGDRPDSYLLENTPGGFQILEGFQGSALGMVTDAVWSDFDGDGLADLIVVGEWMPPRFFKNSGGRLVPEKDFGPSGLWQSILPYDIDRDGDMDYLLGNWGTNSKFVASGEFPLRMYFADFDSNGSTETVLATAKNGSYYPLVSLDELSSQMVSLRKKYPSYKDFAGKTLEESMGSETLAKAELLEATELRSGYLKNDGGSFSFHPFPPTLQVAPIMDFCGFDFDGDGSEEVLAGGNYFGVKPYQGRLDSFPGALIMAEDEILPGNLIGLDFMNKSVRHLAVIHLNNQPYLLAVFNDAPAEVYQLTNINE